jgi:hypothetical protein
MRSKSKMTREEAIRWLESVADADLPSVLATEVPSREADVRASAQVVDARPARAPETPVFELVAAWMGNVLAAKAMLAVLRIDQVPGGVPPVLRRGHPAPVQRHIRGLARGRALPQDETPPRSAAR